MSDSQQENVKRRLRARIIDALTTKIRQPGEYSRTTVKIAGAIAVLALVAGAALGLGAWRSYQNSDDHGKSSESLKKPSSSSSSRGGASSASTGEDPSQPSVGDEGSSSSEDAKAGEPGGDSEAQGPVTSLLPEHGKKPSAKSAEPPTNPAEPSKKPGEPSAKSGKASNQGLSHVLMQNAATRKCAGQGAKSEAVQQHGCRRSGAGNQAWNLSVAKAGKAPGGRDLVAIRNAKTGKCMDLPGRGPAAEEASVRQSRCNTGGGDNQLWWVDRQKDGKQLIRNAASKSACLQIGKRKAADKEGLPLHVGSCKVGQNNRWVFAR